MAGLTKDSPFPVEIKLHQQSRRLEIAFSDGARFTFSFEFLRIMSPSAEVRGHGPGQETLQTGKREVEISALEPVGNYALQPVFSDGHATGIYSWDYLYGIGEDQDALWADYRKRLAAAGASRDAAAVAPAAASAKPHQAIAVSKNGPAGLTKPMTNPAATAAVTAAATPGAAPAFAPLGTKHKL